VLAVALTGGVASGKSTVAGLLAGRGAAVRDADVVVAELYRPGAAGAVAVRGLFGTGVLAADGGVDRGRLAGIVLADAAALARLEATVHPLVRTQIHTWLDEAARRAPAPRVAVVEAALMVESGLYREFDRLVVVTAPEARRHTWAQAAGWPAEKVARVIAVQSADAARIAVADYVVRNEGSLADLADAVERLWTFLLEDAAARSVGTALAPRNALSLP
jgi:dephospho-CoA kinase